MMSELRERLSDVSHDIWSHWMRWMFTVGTFNDDGTWTMPAAKVVRWQGQMETPYAYLTEREKDSDREQADKILAVLATLPVPDATSPVDDSTDTSTVDDSATPVTVAYAQEWPDVATAGDWGTPSITVTQARAMPDLLASFADAPEGTYYDSGGNLRADTGRGQLDADGSERDVR